MVRSGSLLSFFCLNNIEHTGRVKYNSYAVASITKQSLLLMSSLRGHAEDRDVGYVVLGEGVV